jgi:hypothetical protein
LIRVFPKGPKHNFFNLLQRPNMIRSLFLSNLLFTYALGHPISLLPHEVLTLQPQSSSSPTVLSSGDIKDMDGCRPITIVSAYIEKDGNVGPAFFKSLVKMMHGRDSVAFQEMNFQFDGDASHHSGTDRFSGGKIMARMVSQALDDCPSTKLVLSGSGYVPRERNRSLWMIADSEQTRQPRCAQRRSRHGPKLD